MNTIFKKLIIVTTLSALYIQQSNAMHNKNLANTAGLSSNQMMLAIIGEDMRKSFEKARVAASEGATQTLERAIDKIPELAGVRIDLDGNTLLHLAAGHGHPDCVQLLLNHKKAIVNLGNRNGETPLHWAAGHGHPDCVNLLLDHKANVHRKTKAGETALQLATRHNKPECVEMILNHPVIDQKNWSSLHNAAANGDDNVVMTLLKQKAQVDCKSVAGFTPLHLAALHGNSKCVESLIIAGADTTIVTKNGKTAESLAYNEATRASITNAITESIGESAAIQLIGSLKQVVGVNEIVDIILAYIPMNYTAKRPIPTPNPYQTSDESAQTLANRFIITKAIEDQSNMKSWTPLHWAAINDDCAIVEVLLEKKAQIDCKSDAGFTPLHFAAIQGNSKCARTLILAGADINIPLKSGSTAETLASNEATHLVITKAIRTAITESIEKPAAIQLIGTLKQVVAANEIVDIILAYIPIDYTAKRHTIIPINNAAESSISTPSHYQTSQSCVSSCRIL